ncbi:hypothetical protein [Nocardia wallacei]|uniref:hypothetical protein n=1 Tax=Nocardia wallacei TaxID=480035 RepID=UPI002454F4C1|nr:hypothetical protein [Nocardia wallacei]
MRQVLHRSLVADLRDIALGQPRRQHGEFVVTTHDCASLAVGFAVAERAAATGRWLR